MSERSLTFYTKPDCPLCDEGFAAVEPVARRHGLGVEKVDIRDQGDLFYRHRYRIPVVAYGDVELGWGRLDPQAIEEKLLVILEEAS